MFDAYDTPPGGRGVLPASQMLGVPATRPLEGTSGVAEIAENKFYVARNAGSQCDSLAPSYGAIACDYLFAVIPSEAASLPRAKSRGSVPVGMTEFLVKCDSPAYDGGGKALLAFC
jgi:hypothetical protein